MARLVVVEDDADISELLSRRLRSYGHTVLTAPSGPIALGLVGLDFVVECLVLDVGLPGMDGFELLDEFRRHPELDDPELPAVFVSGLALPENFERSQALGCAYLVKPFVTGNCRVQSCRHWKPHDSVAASDSQTPSALRTLSIRD